MTTITQTGTLGSYSFSFTSKTINPVEFAEDFFGGNIKQALIDENYVYLINKQGREIKVELSGFGLDTIEHLDEEMHEMEKFETMGI